jgi:two-component sensor histidine kinase
MADGVELEVEDDGVGVRPDAAPHGIGLGRKLVQRLVSQNHGSITVASESGVRVTVKLPLDCLGRT